MLYSVKTARFGVVLLDCVNIKQAREWARTRFGAKVPSLVRRVQSYKRCEWCDSKPCCCPTRQDRAGQSSRK